MPIRLATLKEQSERFIIVDGGQTLKQLLQNWQGKISDLEQHYLVVTQLDVQHRVILGQDLTKILAIVGQEALDQRLDKLPLKLADRIVPVDTPSSSQEILDWVALHPGSVTIIVDGSRIVGLFANPYRSGNETSLPLSLSELHGDLARLKDDPRFAIEINVKPPRCPHCGKLNFFRFDVDLNSIFCPACGQTIDGLLK